MAIHRIQPVAAARSERERFESTLDPAIAELLDYLARELAEEYVRLMEAAASPPDARHVRKAEVP